MSRITRIKAKQAIVSPACREMKGVNRAGQGAVHELFTEYLRLAYLPMNGAAKFHFVLTVERQVTSDE